MTNDSQDHRDDKDDYKNRDKQANQLYSPPFR